MIGRELDELAAISSMAAREIDRTGTPVLRATGVGRRGVLEPADIDVYDGEVVGIAGLLGSGRTELVRLLYGADRADSGQIEINGRPVRMTSPRSAIDKRIVFSSEDRRAEGIIGDLTVAREHRARHPGPSRLDATHPPHRAGRHRGRVHQGPRTCGRPTRTCAPGTSPAATSRRCCWPAGSRPRPS